MENNNVVYKHTNPENGLVYYGIAEDYLERWDNGFGYQANKQFWNDIVKYGWRNFKHEIIFENLTREEAKFYEGLLIQETQSYLPENGYNQNIGERMEYKEIKIDNDNSDNYTRRLRVGRTGIPVHYAGKIYSTIKELCDEIGEDNLTVSQMLNPNCTRKIAPHLATNGLRYATDEEIINYYQTKNNLLEKCGKS